MHKNEFIRQVARESGLPQATVNQVLGAVVRVIGRSLIAGEKVVWTGFGTFEMRRRSERRGINPQTRQQITIDATHTPGFTASSTFKGRVVGAGGGAAVGAGANGRTRPAATAERAAADRQGLRARRLSRGVAEGEAALEEVGP